MVTCLCTSLITIFCFCDIDKYISNMLGHSYFASPDYLLIQGLIRVMLLYPTNVLQAWPNVHHVFKFFLEVVM